MLHLTNDSEVGIRGKEAMRLHSMHVPFNGDPLDEEESGVASDWDDEPEPDVQQLPNPQYATPAINVKVVVFDILGTIFVSLVQPCCFSASCSPRLHIGSRGKYSRRSDFLGSP